MPETDFVPSEVITQARYVKFPEEMVLHREAARITDRMLDSGVQLVAEAVAAGGDLPTEAELERHVTVTGTRLMYTHHRNIVISSLLAGGLVYSGPNVMMGYARSRADLARGADLVELRTGDLARVVGPGLFQVVGRLDRQAKGLGEYLGCRPISVPRGIAGNNS